MIPKEIIEAVERELHACVLAERHGEDCSHEIDILDKWLLGNKLANPREVIKAVENELHILVSFSRRFDSLYSDFSNRIEILDEWLRNQRL